MKKWLLTAAVLVADAGAIGAHDPNGVPITWNREISRIVYERCASCHREGGTSFSLMTFQEAQPYASAIKDSVLARRMPPWGAVKGFGSFRNDQGLTQEQISVVADWVEGGVTRGNNRNSLPPVPKFDAPATFVIPRQAIPVTGPLTLDRAVTLDGVYPERVPAGASMPVVAVRPGGDVEPLIWLYEYSEKTRHPFLFRKPIELPAGTVIRGVAADTKILLLPKHD
jgi:hypothetical protein